MPADVELSDEGESLYRASRYWGFAGDEWDAAADWLPEARLGRFALGLAYAPTSPMFIDAYNECVDAFEDRVREGAENLREAAAALRASADEYIEVDEGLRNRFDQFAPDGEQPPGPDLGPAFDTPH